MSSVFLYLSSELKWVWVPLADTRAWEQAPGFLRRSLSRGTFVALWAGVKGHALCTSQREPQTGSFLTHNFKWFLLSVFTLGANLR